MFLYFKAPHIPRNNVAVMKYKVEAVF